MGLNPRKHCGKTLAALQPLLLRLHDSYDLHVCGEGGEYETFTVDGPLFHKRIAFDNTRVVMHSDDAIAPVGYLRMDAAHLEDKDEADLPPTDHDALVAYAQQLLQRANGVAEFARGPQLQHDGEKQEDGEKEDGEKEDGEQEDERDDTAARVLSAWEPPHVQTNWRGPWAAIFIAGSPSSLSSQKEARSEATSLALQARDALGLLKEELGKHGAGVDAVRHVNLSVGRMDQFAAINSEYIQVFGWLICTCVCVCV